MSLSQIVVDFVKEETKENQFSIEQKVKEERGKNQQQKTNAVSNSILELLAPSFVGNIGQFFTPKDALQWAQASKYYLNLVDSQLNFKFALRNKILTEENFSSRFCENGFYKEA